VWVSPCQLFRHKESHEQIVRLIKTRVNKSSSMSWCINMNTEGRTQSKHPLPCLMQSPRSHPHPSAHYRIVSCIISMYTSMRLQRSANSKPKEKRKQDHKKQNCRKARMKSTERTNCDSSGSYFWCLRFPDRAHQLRTPYNHPNNISLYPYSPCSGNVWAQTSRKKY